MAKIGSYKVKAFLFVCLCLLMAGCASFSRGDRYQASSEQFRKDLSLTVNMILDLESTEAEIVSQSITLLRSGEILLKNMKNKAPQCSEMFRVVNQNIDRMLQMSIDEIEEQFHQGRALPEGDDLCVESKEFVVHPATVIVILKEKGLNEASRDDMMGELGELAYHLDNVEALLGSR